MIKRRTFALASLPLAACGGGSTAPNVPMETTPTVNPNTDTSTPPATPAQAWRPRYHYTPARNWMNDPNGLVYFDGEYHLYYQYNPFDAQWGSISWGHAVSRDLVAWQELPVAIAASAQVMAFSGSVVVDHLNSGGFAPAGSATPALVAFFTGFNPATQIQSQHLAYSLDRGRSYTAYAGNPIIDIGSTEFRDPKVFWHAATQRWVMLVAAALRQEIWIYNSTDLKAWTRVSTFGPAGSAANNIWEVPELVALAVDGNPARQRWVLVVSVNHGALWPGSGVQYFIGDFDGQHFLADPSDTVNALAPPPGVLMADFEGATLPAGWQLSGSAFGSGPVSGALAGQGHVSGHLGRGLMNSFHGGDGSTGTLSSPPFTITRPFISVLLAGGSSTLTRLELLVGNQVMRRMSGDDSQALKWQSWDVSALLGLEAVLRAVDESTGAWGHILLDHIVMGDAPVAPVSMADITLWADHGRDFYAPITFANVPDGRVLWLGWMSNWDYARLLPTQPWRGQQSSVRQLDLITTPRGLRLRQRIADEVRALVDPIPEVRLVEVSGPTAAAAIQLAALSGRQWMFKIVLSAQGLLAPIGMEVFKNGNARVRAGYDPVRRSFFIERNRPEPALAAQTERHEAKRLLDGPTVSLELWVDGSTLELFADDGSVVISDLAYPDLLATGVALFHGGEDPQLLSVELHRVRAALR